MATEFRALSSRTSSGLVALVNQAIADGWQPFGSINTAGPSSIVMVVARGDDVTSAITEFDIAVASSRALMIQRANIKLAAGFKPFGGFSEQTSQYAVALIKGDAGTGGGSTTVAWADVTGKPTTFAPIIGTTASTAKAGNYAPSWSEVTGKPTTFAPTIGTSPSTAKAGDYLPSWSDITGKPAVIAAGADAAAARTAIGAGTPYTLPNAATAVRGGVLLAASPASTPAQTSAQIATTATLAEVIDAYNKLQADYVGSRTVYSALVGNLRTAGVVSSS